MFLSPKVRDFLSGGTFFTIVTMVGVACGLGLGFLCRGVKDDWTERELMYLKFPGELFLRMLGAMILPLIFSSLVDAVGSLDLSISKKIGVRALVFYLGTTAIAAVLGIVLGVIIKPGEKGSSDMDMSQCAASNSSTEDTLLDLVRNIFPSNLVGATLEVSATDYKDEDFDKPTGSFTRGTNMMGVVVFSMVLGVTLGIMGETGKPVLNFFKSLGEASMLIIGKIVMISPLAICFLIAQQIVAADDPVEVFKKIAWYFATVMIGLSIHGLIILPGLFILLTRKLPFKFFMNMFEALAVAFGTASSSATLPITMKCLEEKNNVDIRVSRFVIPIGATVNMNGTALYLPVGAIYIAQICGLTLSIGQLVTVSLVSIATSVGAAGIPQVGMVILMTVLSSVGLPVDLISYIMPLDWLLERFRTAVNVLGDSVGAGICAHMSKADLAKIPLAHRPSLMQQDNDEKFGDEKDLESGGHPPEP